ncbi:MAG: hypothetical protein HeimC2_42420 [Candidatus Heimdallarchaeota archaeon LC_2]|nr:MAG: hypothetical protein HeimC2_42420 [Candidatus Heimdallarchaeota archaeon LC_2]
MGIYVQITKLLIFITLYSIIIYAPISGIAPSSTNSIKTQDLIITPLPGQNDWDDAIKIADGRYGYAVPSTSGLYHIFIKSGAGTGKSIGTQLDSTMFMYTTEDLTNLYNEIDLQSYDIRSLVWDGDQFIGVSQDGNYIDSTNVLLNGERSNPSNTKSNYRVQSVRSIFQQNNGQHFVIFRSSSGNFYVYYQQIDETGIIGTQFYTGEVTSSLYYYDIMQHSDDTYYMLFNDGTGTKIKATTSDWNLGTVNLISTEYDPVEIFEYQNQIVVILEKLVTSTVDGIQHMELFQTASNDGITWSAPTRITPDNGHDKWDPQLLPQDDGSYALIYENDNEIFILQSDARLTSTVTAPSNTIQQSGTVNLSGQGSFTNGTSLKNMDVIWDIYYPNQTLWFSWATITDGSGYASSSFNMSENADGGYYFVVMAIQVPNFGVAKSVTKFSYLYRSGEIPLALNDPIVTLNSDSVSVDVSGRYDSLVKQFWMTISVLDPENIPFQSVTKQPYLEGNFTIILSLDLYLDGSIRAGSYQGQIIIRLAPPEDDGKLVDYLEFSFNV